MVNGIGIADVGFDHMTATRLEAIGPRLAAILAIFVAMSAPLDAATWYVTQSGAGKMNGTLGNAWPVSAFNSGANWSATVGTAGKISPGDTVNILSTISGNMSCSGNGSSGNVITVAFDPASTMSGTFAFNGKDYIRMTGMRLPDNRSIASPVVTFGNLSTIVRNYCQVDNIYS
jgi:hypothetical protein